MSPNAGTSTLIAGLSQKTMLSADDQARLRVLPIEESSVQRGQDLVREGDRTSRCILLISGLTGTYKSLPDGKRQITAFHIAGEFPDLHGLHLEYQDQGLRTMTDCRVGYIRHRDIHELCRSSPELAAALWRVTQVEAAVHREWTANLGQRQATTRMAHLFCEILTKLEHIGLADDHAATFPITQAEWADALGLSVVHVNRTLMDLRHTGSVRLENGELTALDWPLLKQQGQFDPAYLHLLPKEKASLLAALNAATVHGFVPNEDSLV